jgi:hypothetical protein
MEGSISVVIVRRACMSVVSRSASAAAEQIVASSLPPGVGRRGAVYFPVPGQRVPTRLRDRSGRTARLRGQALGRQRHHQR